MASRDLKVLVAEDNPFISDLMLQGLSSALQRQYGLDRLRFSIRSARDGGEALRLLDEDSYDLLICDVMMPVIGGIELIRRARAAPRHQRLKILAMSGLGSQVEREVLAAGADRFLEKPMQLNRLAQVLSVLLDLSAKV